VSIPDAGWLSARDAAALLDVKLQTLYAYASRGLVTSMPSPSGRGHRYALDSIERLKARHDARAGHGAVAASALRFGEPALETSISEIRSDGPYYRGHSALELCKRRVSFEAVFDLLIAEEPIGQTPPHWARAASPPLSAADAALNELRKRRVLLPRGSPGARLATLLSLAALTDPARHEVNDQAELIRARRLVCQLAERVGARRPEQRIPAAGTSISRRILVSLTGRYQTHACEVLDRTLILCADHELNASTFAARVAASTGADLYACLSAALHTLTGPKHGGVSTRVEALITRVREPARAAEVMQELAVRGEFIPGFGHPLYPRGDPRARALFELAEAAAEHGREPSHDYACLRAICDHMQHVQHPAPNFDMGLAAVCMALELPPGSAAALFAIGRMPGWIAHVLEQRKQRYILRPRARYVVR